jgi:hypothetical protein
MHENPSFVTSTFVYFFGRVDISDSIFISIPLLSLNYFFFLLAVLGFELRASHLLARYVPFDWFWGFFSENSTDQLSYSWVFIVPHCFARMNLS